MYNTAQLIEVRKDGVLLEYITIDRQVKHDGEPILQYKLVVDTDYYQRTDYDIFTFNEHRTSNKHGGTNKELSYKAETTEQHIEGNGLLHSV